MHIVLNIGRQVTRFFQPFEKSEKENSLCAHFGNFVLLIA